MDFRDSILLSNQLSNPSEEFVRYFAKKAYPSVVAQKVPEQFSTITRKSFSLIVSGLINDRLKPALKTETTKAEPLTGEQPDEQETKPENGIETTEEEMEAYLIVKSILRQKIDPQRIHLRDASRIAPSCLTIITGSPFAGSILTERRSLWISPMRTRSW